jgi:asparagine synthase (glutamine-hydrolysing)
MLANSLRRMPGFILSGASKFMNKIPPNWIEKCYYPWQHRLPPRFQVTNFQDKWQKLIQLMGNVGLQELYRSTICVWSKNEVKNLIYREIPPSQYEDFFNESNSISLLSKLMRVDLRTYLPDAMLTKVDRASMASGLEIRVPLLDHRIVEYSSRLPDSLKYRNGSGKYLLKRLLARYMPVELFQRPKMGFGVPIARWFRCELKHLMLDYLSRERLRQEGLFDPAFVQEKISEHLSGRVNHQYKIWSLLMWEMWKERWLG